ncbi:response regulator [Halobellus sp. GM3]|uniref:response regulator n=1 Tax=Halobellus sp. GM3 TaxID=3458410 RepID=UPI00403E0556
MLPSSDTIRVLHVDDEPGFAGLTASFLEREDERFDVDTAGRPDEGLRRLETNAYDCVVSDHDMPGRNGIDFLEAVREEYPRLPFVLFTGKGSEEVASDAISAGVSDYLQKQPGNEQYQLLAARVRAHVDRVRARRELEARESHLQQAQLLADLGSWYKDVREDEIYWSEEIYEIFAIDEREGTLDHTQFMEYVHPADREHAEEAWNDALDGAEYDIEHRIVTGDGETRWVRERAEIEFGDGGDPIEAVGVVQDITDRKTEQ